MEEERGKLLVIISHWWNWKLKLTSDYIPLSYVDIIIHPCRISPCPWMHYLRNALTMSGSPYLLLMSAFCIARQSTAMTLLKNLTPCVVSLIRKFIKCNRICMCSKKSSNERMDETLYITYIWYLCTRSLHYALISFGNICRFNVVVCRKKPYLGVQQL